MHFIIYTVLEKYYEGFLEYPETVREITTDKILKYILNCK